MQNAELYVETNQMQYKEAGYFLELCKSGGHIAFKEMERILDIGCGPGDVTSRLLYPMLPSDSQLVGVDLSHEMVNYANANFASDRVSFRQASIEDPHLDTKLNIGKFDKIFSFHCLQWITNQRQAFENLNRLLKPGGSMYLVFIASSIMNDINERLLHHPKWKQHLKVLEHYNPKLSIEGSMEEYFCGILKDLNFSVTECRLVDSKHTFKNIEQVKGQFKAIHPAVSHMRPEVLLSFIEDFNTILFKDKLCDLDVSTGQITTANLLAKFQLDQITENGLISLREICRQAINQVKLIERIYKL